MQFFTIEKWFEEDDELLMRFYIDGKEIQSAYASDLGFEGIATLERLFVKTARALGEKVEIKNLPSGRTVVK